MHIGPRGDESGRSVSGAFGMNGARLSNDRLSTPDSAGMRWLVAAAAAVALMGSVLGTALDDRAAAEAAYGAQPAASTSVEQTETPATGTPEPTAPATQPTETSVPQETTQPTTGTEDGTDQNPTNTGTGPVNTGGTGTGGGTGSTTGTDGSGTSGTGNNNEAPGSGTGEQGGSSGGHSTTAP